jgi:hypothetical protein
MKPAPAIVISKLPPLQVLNTGASVSFTVTSKLQVEVLPSASVATDVTVVVPIANTLPDAGVLTTVTPGQLSVAPTVNVTAAPHNPASLLTVTFDGHVITGNSVSFTVTSKLHSTVVLPDASVASNVFVVVPIGNTEPLANPEVCVTATPGQLSEAVGDVYVMTAPHTPASLSTVTSAGQASPQQMPLDEDVPLPPLNVPVTEPDATTLPPQLTE